MQPGSKPRVLLVEDEEGLRQTLRLNLELEGYHVTTAATGPRRWNACAGRGSMRP